MSIRDIDAASFATNVGQTAAARMASLLWAQEGDAPLDPIINWATGLAGVPSTWRHDALELDDADQLEAALDRLGTYVCAKGVDKGEWLYRQAVDWALIPRGIWGLLPFEQRQPWETFVAVTRGAYADIRGHQLALEETDRPRAGSVPVTIGREDSIFEEVTDFDELVPEAVESLRLSGAYQRGQDEQRKLDAAEDALREQAEADNAQWDADQAKLNGASPAKFDGDGDGRPGGSKPKAMSVGEQPVRPPVNRGGRGRKKTS